MNNGNNVDGDDGDDGVIDRKSAVALFLALVARIDERLSNIDDIEAQAIVNALDSLERAIPAPMLAYANSKSTVRRWRERFAISRVLDDVESVVFRRDEASRARLEQALQHYRGPKPQTSGQKRARIDHDDDGSSDAAPDDDDDDDDDEAPSRSYSPSLSSTSLSSVSSSYETDDDDSISDASGDRIVTRVVLPDGRSVPITADEAAAGLQDYHLWTAWEALEFDVHSSIGTMNVIAAINRRMTTGNFLSNIKLVQLLMTKLFGPGVTGRHRGRNIYRVCERSPPPEAQAATSVVNTADDE